MAKVTITFNNKEIKEICDEIDCSYAVTVSPKMMRGFLKRNMAAAVDLAESGVKYGVDTESREKVIDAISQELVKEDWPGGDISVKELTRFYKNFAIAAKKVGIKVNFGDDY